MRELTKAQAATIPDAMRVQYWLAEIDQHGNAKLVCLVDGAHSNEAGAHRAFYLFQALGLGSDKQYAVARVELIDVRPDATGADQDAINTINAGRAALATREEERQETGRVASPSGSREPSPAVSSASGFDPSRTTGEPS